jgi:hypothetical protein
MPAFRTTPHSLHLSRYVGTCSPHGQNHSLTLRGGDSLGVNLAPADDDDVAAAVRGGDGPFDDEARSSAACGAAAAAGADDLLSSLLNGLCDGDLGDLREHELGVLGSSR